MNSRALMLWTQLMKTVPSDNEYALTAKRMLARVRASEARLQSATPKNT